MERTVTAVPEDELHTHPASELIKTANRFDTDARPGHADEGDLVPATNMLAVTGPGVGHDESVRLVAEGDDAEAALSALKNVLSTPEVKQ